MNYKLSPKILAEIKKVKRILLNCHVSPDPDSVGGTLALAKVLSNFGKVVEIISSEEIDESLNFLKEISSIKISDLTDFNYSRYDLFIVLDSSSLDRAISGNFKLIPIPILNIDHHQANEMFGKINLVNEKLTSVSELLYQVFQDWGVEIDTEIATDLLTGIISDSGVYRYPGTTPQTLRIAADLMEKGADSHQIILNIYDSYGMDYFKFWSETFNRLKYDKEGKFIWSAIPYEVNQKLGGKKPFKEFTASLFFKSVKGSEFGMMMVESKRNELRVSFRSRTGIDTSAIARALGGGGHIYAAGATVKGLPFEEAVNKVLEVARKYAKKTS